MKWNPYVETVFQCSKQCYSNLCRGVRASRWIAPVSFRYPKIIQPRAPFLVRLFSWHHWHSFPEGCGQIKAKRVGSLVSHLPRSSASSSSSGFTKAAVPGALQRKIEATIEQDARILSKIRFMKNFPARSGDIIMRCRYGDTIFSWEDYWGNLYSIIEVSYISVFWNLGYSGLFEFLKFLYWGNWRNWGRLLYLAFEK